MPTGRYHPPITLIAFIAGGTLANGAGLLLSDIEGWLAADYVTDEEGVTH